MQSYDVLVIGGGQAGLSIGWYLKQQGVKFAILDANGRTGDSWRNRWDSLRLFTPARYDGLVGMPFPAHPDYMPTKDEMGDYLENYAKHFDLPVINGVRVERLSRQDGKYVVEGGGRRWWADHVVVATAGYQVPKMPGFGADFDAGIVQLHSSEYKNPGQLREGGVLLVGAGNSGAEIAMDVVKTRPVYLSGRPVGHVPVPIDSFLGKYVVGPLLIRVIFHRLLTVKTPLGRKARTAMLAHGGPLIRQRPGVLEAAGVERVPRVAGAKDGKPVLDDGRVLDVQNVIWCTGYKPSFGWIELPIFEADGYPRHDSGIATDQPGLYFVGMHFQYAASSSMVHGVGRDAERVAGVIAARLQQPMALTAAQAA